MPPGAQLLLTTRLRAVMDDLGGGVYALDVMTPDDALALVAEQLRWSPEADGDREWVDELIAGVGRHPLALSVALGILRREGHYPSERRDSAARVVESVRSGRNLDHLQLETADREHNVEAVLAISYDVLAPEDRRLLRSLGAFALEADFTTAQAALVWECEPEAARRHLVDFGNAALVTRVNEQTWRQHALLRGYCLAWLHAEGEYEQTAYRHAVAYNAAMREADDAQRYYQLLPGMAQLRHAFTWAVDADLDLALDLVANCANLMAAFGLAREQANWCTRVLETSRQRGQPSHTARAQVSLGNALSRLATLPGEERRERLYDALAAYDEALRFYRPDTAPLAYAMTQNNRANMLSELATLPGEDRRAAAARGAGGVRRGAALLPAGHGAAGLCHDPEQPGQLLSELASLPGEDRRAAAVLRRWRRMTRRCASTDRTRRRWTMPVPRTTGPTC